MRIITLFVLILPSLLFSNSKIDSLIQILPNLKGEEKIKTYLDLSDALRHSDSHLALDYANKGVLLSQKEGLINWESKFYTNIGVIYSIQSDYKKSNNFFEKAIELYQKVDNANGMGKAYANMGVNSQQIGEYDKAMEYLVELKHKGLDFYKRTKHPLVRIEVKVLFDNGNVFRGELISVREAMKYLEHIKEFAEEQ